MHARYFSRCFAAGQTKSIMRQSDIWAVSKAIPRWYTCTRDGELFNAKRHNRVFVAATDIGLGYEATQVSVIDARSGRVVGQVMVGRGPASLAVDTTTGLLFVANGSDGTVSVLDPARL